MFAALGIVRQTASYCGLHEMWHNPLTAIDMNLRTEMKYIFVAS